MSERVTAVVVNWNSAADAAECIESLLRTDGVSLGTLLVDNASTDNSVARLRERFATIDMLQAGANLGYAGGNNRGIERVLAGGAELIACDSRDFVQRYIMVFDLWEPAIALWMTPSLQEGGRFVDVGANIGYH